MATKVTDLRTGLVHPRRDHDGRFLARRDAARRVYWRSVALDKLDIPTLRKLVRAWNTQAKR